MFLRVRQLRESLDWTIAHLAEQAAIAPGTAGTYDRDQTTAPNRHVLAKLAGAMGVTISELFADFPCATGVSFWRLGQMTWAGDGNAAAVHIALNRNGSIIGISPNCQAVTGWATDDLLNHSIQEFAPGTWVGEEGIVHLLSSSDPDLPEYWGDFHHADGRTIRVRWHDAVQITPELFVCSGEVRP